MAGSRKRALVILSCVLAVLVIPNTLVRILPSRARRALPRSATEVKEEYDGCVFWDFARILRAKLPEADYQLFIRNYGGLKEYDPAIHSDDILVMINCYYGQPPHWWNENYKRVDGGYFLSEPGDHFVRVKYCDGWLYFLESRT